MKELTKMKKYIQVNRALRKMFWEHKQKEIEFYGDALTEKRFTKTYHYSKKNPVFISMGKQDKYSVYYFEKYVIKVFYFFDINKDFMDKNVRIEIINKTTKAKESFFFDDDYAFEENFDFDIMLRGYNIVLADNHNWKLFKEDFNKYHINGEYKKKLQAKYDEIEKAKEEYRNLYDETVDSVFRRDDYKELTNEMSSLVKTYNETREQLKKEYEENYNKAKEDRTKLVNDALAEAKVNEKDKAISDLLTAKQDYINTYSTPKLREKYGVKHNIYSEDDFKNIKEV